MEILGECRHSALQRLWFLFPPQNFSEEPGVSLQGAGQAGATGQHLGDIFLLTCR